MSPRAKGALPTREQIIDATASVIRSIGLGRATTKEIAQAAGLSEAALYRYFTDKMDLFVCVMGERVPQFISALSDLPERVGHRTVRINLEDIAREALQFYDHTLPIATALFAEPDLLARHQEQLRSKEVGPQRTIDMLGGYIRAEQRLMRLNQRADPDAAASLLLGACAGRALIRRFTGQLDSAEDDDRFVRQLVRTLLIGLAPEPSA